MSLVKEQWEFLKDVAELIVYIHSIGFTATGGELWRTKEQQEIYVKQGKSKTKNSKHLERLAIDLNFFDSKGNLIVCPDMIGNYWESLSDKNEWGGNWAFVDAGHFQRNR